MAVKMSFNSWDFLLFFPTVFFLYYALPHRLRWQLLLAASCIFYMAFIPYYIAILFATIIVDYLAGILIYRSQGIAKEFYLYCSVIVTCLILFFFKYFDFVTLNINWLSKTFGMGYEANLLGIILPIGLSFHTFQSLSYVVEVYRGHQQPERHFGIYSLYVLFFPQMVAGPIERPQNMLHQFHKKINFDYEKVKSGAMLLAFGLFKKIVIADRLAEYVDLVFKSPGNYDTASIALALVFFYFQIYCDFSGYTDIARGSARMLGFELMKNFNIPFIADSLTNFWKRWHISLSTWLRDYVYEPLSMVMRYQGIFGIGLALLMTFFISGLWHGAKWTFVVWGLFNGVILLWEFLLGVYKKKKKILPIWIGKPLAIIRTFVLICASYIFFRSDSMSTAILIIKKLFAFPIHYEFGKILQVPMPHNYFLISTCLILLLIVVELLNEKGRLIKFYECLPKIVRLCICQVFIVFLLWYGYWFKGHTSFIYFQF